MDLPALPPEAAQQLGRFSHAQARAAGWSSRSLARAVRRQQLLHVAHGVYASTDQVADPVLQHAAALRAAQLASRQRWAGARRTAALVLGLPLIGRPPVVPQMLRDGGRRGAQGRDRHARVGPLPSAHTEERNGLLLTTGARTTIDIARQESFRNGVVMADAALRRGVPDEDLHGVLTTMCRWPGVARARLVVGFADGRAESPLESITRVAFLHEGLEVPEPQVEVWLDGVFVARVDLLLREPLLAIEADGAAKFDGPTVLPKLVERQERLRACGVDVLRTWWDDVFTDTWSFGQRVRQRLDERGARRLPPGVELRSTSPASPHGDFPDLSAA